MTWEQPTSVWIDDTHPIFRGGLSASLRADGFRVLGESEALSPTPQLDGSQVLLFETTPATLPRAVRLTAEVETVPVALVDAPPSDLVADVVEAGVPAILPRSTLTPSLLATTLRAVCAGNATLPARLLEQLLDRAANGARQGTGHLTARELDVLRLLAEGEDTKEIASSLCYSERTVKNVVHDLLVKMNCRNRVHAVALAARRGVI